MRRSLRLSHPINWQVTRYIAHLITTGTAACPRAIQIVHCTRRFLPQRLSIRQSPFPPRVGISAALDERLLDRYCSAHQDALHSGLYTCWLFAVEERYQARLFC